MSDGGRAPETAVGARVVEVPRELLADDPHLGGAGRRRHGAREPGGQRGAGQQPHVAEHDRGDGHERPALPGGPAGATPGPRAELHQDDREDDEPAQEDERAVGVRGREHAVEPRRVRRGRRGQPAIEPVADHGVASGVGRVRPRVARHRDGPRASAPRTSAATTTSATTAITATPACRPLVSSESNGRAHTTQATIGVIRGTTPRRWSARAPASAASSAAAWRRAARAARAGTGSSATHTAATVPPATSSATVPVSTYQQASGTLVDGTWPCAGQPAGDVDAAPHEGHARQARPATRSAAGRQSPRPRRESRRDCITAKPSHIVRNQWSTAIGHSAAGPVRHGVSHAALPARSST